MCYDMSFFATTDSITEYLEVAPSPLPFEPTYHKVAQSFCPWPVVLYEDGKKVRFFEWGLIADYMNTPEKIREYRSSMANARSEKLINDPRSVWHRIRKQRCLVCTTGFFEHQDTGHKKKTPYFIHVRDERVFCFAGLYNYAPKPHPETGELTGTFAIITREGNSLLQQIHNSGPNQGRMPLILTRDQALRWIDPRLTDEEIREIVDTEYPAAQLEAWPVNTIRRPKEDNQSVIARVQAEN
jgi:putative SOS response-associated peptidase YedK